MTAWNWIKETWNGSGRYLLTYMWKDNEFIKSMEIVAETMDELFDKWEHFALSNGLRPSWGITFLERI